MCATIRARVTKGIYSGYQGFGFQRGFAGLLNDNPAIYFELGSATVNWLVSGKSAYFYDAKRAGYIPLSFDNCFAKSILFPDDLYR